MEKKHVLMGMAVALLIVGALAYPSARWFLVTLGARTPVEKLGRFPDATQILGLREAIREVGRKYKLDPAKLQVNLAVEVRGMMGSGIPFTYVLVDCTDGERTWSYRMGSERGHRIETSHSSEFLDALREGGVDLSKMESAPSPVVVPAGAGQGGGEGGGEGE